MSSAYPYLQKLRKSDLAEFAETTKLENYASLKKAELETALDGHLTKNQSTYESDKSLSEYYKRLGPKPSPIKKMVEKVSEMVKSEDELPVKKPRRKTVHATEGESATSALIKTPGKELARRSSALIPSNFPPSPAVVTDAIDRQTSRMRNSISEAYTKSNISEYIDVLRDVLSSPYAIIVVSTLVEMYGLRAEIFPFKVLVDAPAVKYVKDTKTKVYGPDVFLLFNASFLAPLSLWLLTSVLLPLTLSYFVNIPLKTHPSHSYKTRKATLKSSPYMQVDPLIFNVAKASIAYVVYAQHFGLSGLYQHFTVATVNESILGGYTGTIATSSIGALIALYEAALKK